MTKLLKQTLVIASYTVSQYLLNFITMTEYVNSFLSLTLLGIIYYIYCKYKIFLRAIVMDYVILDQLNNLGKDVDSEVIKLSNLVVAKRKPALKRCRQ